MGFKLLCRGSLSNLLQECLFMGDASFGPMIGCGTGWMLLSWHHPSYLAICSVATLFLVMLQMTADVGGNG